MYSELLKTTYPNLLYDLHSDSFWDPMMFIPFVLFISGLIIIFYNYDVLRSDVLNEVKLKARKRMIFGIVFTSFSGIIGLLLIFFTFISFRCAQDAYSNGYLIIEGKIDNFKPYSNLHKKEEFTVDSVYFKYSKNVLGPGFKNNGKNSVKVTNGLRVRIRYYYVNGENIILKMESE